MVRMTNNLRRRRIQGEGGFTLIELLIVIVILGILAGVVVASVSGITNKGASAACQTDTKTIITAEETYYATPTGVPPVSGVYANMNWPALPAIYQTPVPAAGWVPQPMVPGFLQSKSTLHAVRQVPAVAVPPTPATYMIYVISPQCGTPVTAAVAPIVGGPNFGAAGFTNAQVDSAHPLNS